MPSRAAHLDQARRIFFCNLHNEDKYVDTAPCSLTRFKRRSQHCVH